MATQASKSSPRRTQDGLTWGYCHRLDAEKKSSARFTIQLTIARYQRCQDTDQKAEKTKTPLTKGGHGAGDAECP